MASSCSSNAAFVSLGAQINELNHRQRETEQETEALERTINVIEVETALLRKNQISRQTETKAFSERIKAFDERLKALERTAHERSEVVVREAEERRLAPLKKLSKQLAAAARKAKEQALGATVEAARLASEAARLAEEERSASAGKESRTGEPKRSVISESRKSEAARKAEEKCLASEAETCRKLEEQRSAAEAEEAAKQREEEHIQEERRLCEERELKEEEERKERRHHDEEDQRKHEERQRRDSKNERDEIEDQMEAEEATEQREEEHIQEERRLCEERGLKEEEGRKERRHHDEEDQRKHEERQRRDSKNERDEIEDQMEEKRFAEDGEAYTYAEFVSFFGEADGKAYWEAAEAITTSSIGEPTTTTSIDDEPTTTEMSTEAESTRPISLSRALSDDILIQDLVNKGFSVGQLLEFYRHYHHTGVIKRGTTTNEVVKNIVIKETCDAPRCYMESEFMMQNGGPQRAKRLVSHAWKSDFVNTVISIVLDATEWPLKFLLDEIVENDSKPCVDDGILDVDHLLTQISKEALNITYWLCIFAVDEHHAICGDCWTCNATLEWSQDPKGHLVAGTCLICGQEKINPCTCGTIKWKVTDPQYEIDKFDRVVAQMEALVVALDGDLNSIRRIWVVAEVAEASQFIPVFFRRSDWLSDWASQKLAENKNFLDTVAKCEATSTADRDRILEQVRSRDGGINAYDMFVNYLLDSQFGKYERLETLLGFAREAANRVISINSDFSWVAQRSDSIPNDLLLLPKFHPQLRHLSLDFEECEQITDISVLACLDKLSCLTNLTLKFAKCSIADISVLTCLENIKTLTNLILSFRSCNQITDISVLECLENLSSLTNLTLDFSFCEQITLSFTNLTVSSITDISFLACLENLSSLTNLT